MLFLSPRAYHVSHDVALQTGAGSREAQEEECALDAVGVEGAGGVAEEAAQVGEEGGCGGLGSGCCKVGGAEEVSVGVEDGGWWGGHVGVVFGWVFEGFERKERESEEMVITVWKGSLGGGEELTEMEMWRICRADLFGT